MKCQMINHIRIMIEEAEHMNGKIKVSSKVLCFTQFNIVTEIVRSTATFSCNDVL